MYIFANLVEKMHLELNIILILSRRILKLLTYFAVSNLVGTLATRLNSLSSEYHVINALKYFCCNLQISITKTHLLFQKL